MQDYILRQRPSSLRVWRRWSIGTHALRQHRRRSARREIGLRLDQRSDRVGDLGAVDQAVVIEQGLVEGQRLNVDQAPVSGGIGGHETIVRGVNALGLDAVRCRLLPQLGDLLGR